MKRDLINEINAIKSRRETDSAWEVYSQLSNIHSATSEYLNLKTNYSREFIKYLPIATVACLENFNRAIVKDVINFGKPYSHNIVKFNQSQNIKIDFDIINAIQSKTLTIGEFVSHILPCNNYEDINSNFSILLGIDFTNSLRNFMSSTDVIDFDKMIRGIKRTFELRHIFCHEIPTTFITDINELKNCFGCCRIFIDQTHGFIESFLYPDSPQTQKEMNAVANIEFEKKDKELSDLISNILSFSEKTPELGATKKLFENFISTWKDYREKKAKHDAAINEGGTAYQMILAVSKRITTEEKIESLKNEYKRLLKKHASS